MNGHTTATGELDLATPADTNASRKHAGGLLSLKGWGWSNLEFCKIFNPSKHSLRFVLIRSIRVEFHIPAPGIIHDSKNYVL
ncbi:hypothetical protein AVEN_188576-1 [Araneus ventricosus]|uniref:Uncharacterized protein n=1 Tax=Araneus ventricosus TaxID=182803 RepID=A0A4Y2TFH9_ARAVE|nr:hypothetical protein AVEN_251998-1 [Araneus ventricosus]GBN97870.1 hypothetical protein AVEN_198865-1 [Araneus ventricosus]GBO02723.1 hypothetical protein AVEN_166143-1 [Araneus ventricosus]GBO02746.1 hypothetical protein AVEN_188576-1 [Araneus ventricosus]